MKRTYFILGFLVLAVGLWGTLCFGSVTFDKSEFAARRSRLMEKIPDGAAIILGAQSPKGNTPLRQNNDFYYLTGIEIPNAFLIVDGVHKESILFYTMTVKQARNEGIPAEYITKTKEVTGIEKILPAEQFSNYLVNLSDPLYAQKDKIKVFYTMFKPEEQIREYSFMTWRKLMNRQILNEWDGRLTRELQFAKHLRERFPGIQVKDCTDMIWRMRTIKSPAEVAVMRRAGKIGAKAMTEAMKATRVGMYEYEIAAIIDYVCKKEGAPDMSYNIIISSGPNHPYFHYYKHDRKLQDGDFIVIDAGPEIDYYCVDISISYPANGKFTPEQKAFYRGAHAMLKTNMKYYKAGMTLTELTKKVNADLQEQGFDLSKDYFQLPSMRPWFGHYVGMAVHDVGIRPGGTPEGPLQAGMVFANEPYGALKDTLGVRVENTILVTEDGCENLTPGIPREVKDIEALMKKDGIAQALKKLGLY